MSWVYERLAALARDGVLPEVFALPFLVRGLLAVLVVGPTLGSLSPLVVSRRLAFFAAAVAQSALTGVALGIALGEPLDAPYAGMFGFCLFAAMGLVYLKRNTALPVDTLIGVFLSLSLGLGVCVLVAATQRFNVHQIEAVMFGSLLTVTDADLVLLVVVGAAVLIVVGRSYNGLVLDGVDGRLGRAAGLGAARLDYVFVAVLTVAIVVSLKILGALLIEALVVIPAAAARPLARSASAQWGLSVLVAVLAGLGGVLASSAWHVPTGAAVVLVLTGLFAMSALVGRLLRR